ncbi:hypothetical protein BJX61DRAFT_536205 [Aspergillus egyptiacus]|nr:hypothetical protein BJX61DRAFT_536205 [Aspergillus egyptiacus]
MRTRSQPQSPGGFISLETAATSRRTRSTRAASRSASAEPNNQPTTEPPKQPATRSQNQRATRNTSTEKDASASKTVDSTTKTAKTQPRKLTKRDTRKATRKTKATSNKPEESVEEKQPDLSGTDNEDNAEAGAEEPQSGLTTSDTALLEPRTSEREYTASFSTSFSVPQFPLPPFTLPFRSSSPTPSSTSPQKPQESQESSSVDGVSNEAAVSLGEATTASARLPEVITSTQETQAQETRTKETKTRKTHRIPKRRKTRKSLTQPNTDQKLTNKKVNRKRAHPEPSPEAQAEAAVPSSNKRRNLGTPKSAPRTRASLRRVPRVSYAQRLQRRRAEGQGRIHSTIFRLPEYVAQTEADRLASETASLTSSSAEPLQTTPDFPTEHAQTDDQAASEQSAAPQEPTTPEPAKRSWNLRGIFGSVPRSLSRLFSRSPDKPEDSDTRQPSSERIRRTRLSEASSPVPPPRETQPRRLSSEQPPAKRPRNLSYSLFPAPIDRSLYLGDIPTKSPAKSPVAAAPATASQPAEKETAERPEVREASAPTVDVRGRDATPQATNTVSESQKKKRKRSPSPDIIPNPPGSSYGLDLDYFCYSSDSEEDEAQSPEPVAPQTEPRKSDGLTKTALRSVFQTERPASKKVRFDASPEDTPSKRRARATDPYHGAQFVGFPHASPTPTTPTPASREYDEPQRRPGFVPNKTGTFELNYDDFSDDSDSSGIASPTSIPAPSPASVAPTPPQPSTPQRYAFESRTSVVQALISGSSLPAPRTIGRPAQPPSTPVRVDEEALARARSQAEKYKPKTPSGLRTASRYSSPLTATPDITPARPIAQPAVHAATQPTAQPAEDVTEKFGDDQFAEDAKWLYENCPSGDLRQLVWPEPQNLAESLNISAEAVRILDEIWDPADVDKAYEIFKREFEDFKKTLAEGTA